MAKFQPQERKHLVARTRVPLDENGNPKFWVRIKKFKDVPGTGGKRWFIVPKGYCAVSKTGETIYFNPHMRPDGKRILAQKADGTPVCGGFLARGIKASLPEFEGVVCASPLTLPNGRCKSHGGRLTESNSGMNNGAYKNGKYASAGLPKTLLADYETLLLDPNLVSTREEIALLDSQILNKLRNLPDQVGNDLWIRLQAIVDMASKALDGKDDEKVRYSLRRITEVVNENRQEADIWKEVLPLIEQRRKLVETQGKLDTTKQKTLTVSELLILVNQIHSMVDRAIDEYLNKCRTRNMPPSPVDLKQQIGTGLKTLFMADQMSTVPEHEAKKPPVPDGPVDIISIDDLPGRISQ